MKKNSPMTMGLCVSEFTSKKLQGAVLTIVLIINEAVAK